MKDLHVLLNDADPVRADPVLPDAEARAMRRVVLAAVTPPQAIAMLWPSAVPVAAVVALMIVAGAAAGRRLAPPEPVHTKAAALEGSHESDRTQVQFATPGGTRIIWTLDPQFELGVMP